MTWKDNKLPLALWLLIVSVLSLTPGNYIPKVGYSYTDLIVHIAMYAGLSLVVYIAFYSHVINHKISNQIWYFVAICMVGVVYEILQGILPIGRFLSWKDMLANSLGACLWFILPYIQFFNRILSNKNGV